MKLTRANGIKTNMQILMTVKSPARRKAISTIARKNNMSRKDATFKQSLAISRSLKK